MDEEVIFGGKLREKCDVLFKSLGEEVFYWVEVESLLEEEWSKICKI